MVVYNKLFELFKEKGITSYVIRQKNLFGQEILRKLKMCSVTPEEKAENPDKTDVEIINAKLEAYKAEKGKEFKADVSTKTIEDLCQLLQCQPTDIMEWHVDLNPDLAYENK